MNWKKFAGWLLSGTGLATVVFSSMVAYYYWKTPSAAIVVSCDDFPSSLSLPFSPDALIDRVSNHLTDMITAADSGSAINELGRREGLGPRAVSQKVLPIRASSAIPSPVFNEKWKTVNLNLARRLGIYLRTKKLLELSVVGATQPGGWRVLATSKEGPDYSGDQVGSAPLGGGQCSDLESCANDVAEQTLKKLDYQRLLNYYIKRDTDNSNLQVLDIYQNVVPQDTLAADDLVAWGNAFLSVHRFDDALEKYQAALTKGPGYCPALIARGVVFNGRPHGSQLLDDLKRAETDFRSGVQCDTHNKFAYVNLCAVRIRQWVNSPARDNQLLTEAQQNCQQALNIDSHFVAAQITIGYILYRQGNHQQSLTYFDNLSQEDPKDGALFANYSFLLYLDYLEGRPERLPLAIEKAKKALELDPENYSSTANLGFFYYEQGDYAEALRFWQKADPLRGDDVDSTAGLALALFKLGHEPEAIAALAKAIRTNPHYREPEYLRKNLNWSSRATSDLTMLLTKL